MKKPFHFNLLYKLFVDNKGNKTNNWRRLIFGVKSNKWSTLKNYILDSVDSHQYGEFFYLLTHQWKVSTCANCGNELKYNNGYKTYCCRKCARVCQHTETQASNTRKQHIKELDDYVTINKDNLSNYDNKYMSKLCVNNKLTKYYISIGSSINKKYANIRYWLNNRIPWANSWSETIYCVLNNIVNIPKCKVCGNNAIYKNFNKGYSRYCCVSCITKDCDVKNAISIINTNNSEERGKKVSIAKQARTREQIDNEIKKSKATRLKRYGDENYSNHDKAIKTNIEKYGCPCPLQAESIKSKYTNKLSNIGRKRLSEHRKKLWQNNEYRENTIISLKKAQQNLSDEKKQSKINGYYAWWNNLSESDKQLHNRNVSNAISLWHTTLSIEQKQNKLEKEYETKQINGTFNTSKMENMIGDYIMSKFPDMKRQYKSAAYPFLCDYYIPSLDIYIEYQGSWTHGGHPFDTQENDNTILKMWQNKHTKYYDNAIHTWTIRDVEKRETAKKNNIKYYELWSDGTNNEFEKHKKFIDSLCVLRTQSHV